MVRSAAKNHERVAVVVDPADYAPRPRRARRRRRDLRRTRGSRLARKAFAHTAAYDGAIASAPRPAVDAGRRRWPTSPRRCARLRRRWRGRCATARTRTRRRRSTPARRAAGRRWRGPRCCRARSSRTTTCSTSTRRCGSCAEFSEPAAVIVKHNNPCGVAVSAAGVAEAYRTARETDPVSAFGGIVAVNREVDGELAARAGRDLPRVRRRAGLHAEALRSFAAKKNLRLLARRASRRRRAGRRSSCARVAGGLLVQTATDGTASAADAKVVSKRAPTAAELRDLDFAWRVCKHVKSNAIVFAARRSHPGRRRRPDVPRRLGQDRRLEGAAPAGTGSVLASDAFFPFRDGVDEAAKAGALRSSSRAARCATPRSSPPPTSTGSRWCSPASATSATKMRV